MHRFAAGYGWAESYVLSMPAASFLGYLKAMIKRENALYVQGMKQQAHLGWQIRQTIAGVMGGTPQSYMEYLDGLGLLDDNEKAYIKFAKQQEKERAKVEAKENMQKAENIVAMMRGGKKTS